MKRLKWAVMVLVVIIALVFALPAAAVTDGELDGNGHPHVVLVVARVLNPNGTESGWRCSGTMLTANVVLTAGHCVNGFPDPRPIIAMRVFTESDVQAGSPLQNPGHPELWTNNYPNAGPNAVEAVYWAAHPLYETAPFYVHDVGIVVLAGAGFNSGVVGTLPSVNSLDSLQPGKKTQFTSVGYGLQKSFPDAAAWKDQAQRTRYVAHPHLIQVNTGFVGLGSLLLSNNANTGGTCFGDSGGPNFLGNSTVVAGITSFGINGNCAGTGGVFRTDRQDVLDFINGFLP